MGRGRRRAAEGSHLAMGDAILDEYVASVVLTAGEDGTDDRTDRNVLYVKQILCIRIAQTING